MLCFDFCTRYTEAEIEALEKKYTKQLLKMHDSFYVRKEMDRLQSIIETLDVLGK